MQAVGRTQRDGIARSVRQYVASIVGLAIVELHKTCIGKSVAAPHAQMCRRVPRKRHLDTATARAAGVRHHTSRRGTLGKDRELSEGGKFGLQAVDKDALGRGPRLHGDTLSLKVCKSVYITVCVHDNYLPAVHVRTCPLIFAFAVCHRKAPPQAVYLFILEIPVLILPDYIFKYRPVPHTAERLLRQLDIYACKIPVFIYIIKRLILIASHNDHRRIFLIISIFPCLRTSAAND